MSEEKPKKTAPPGAYPENIPQERPAQHTAFEQEQSPQPRPSGVGFLGRRGTAPINAVEQQDAATHSFSHSQNEAHAPHPFDRRGAQQDTPFTAHHDTAQNQQYASPQHDFYAQDVPNPDLTGQDPFAYVHKDDMENTSDDVYDLSQEPTPPPTPPSIGEKTFQALNKGGFLALILIFALHGLASIWLPSGFFYAEEAVINTFNTMAAEGQWVIPTDLSVSMMPGYYWFMALLALIPIPPSLFLPVLAWISAFIALTGAYVLSRCLLPKATRGTVPFVAGILLLTSPAFSALGHMIIPEVLTAGFFAFALACLYRGWISTSGYAWFIGGFIFTALATLTGGALPFWTLLCGSILLVLWRTTLGRAHKLDAVMGFSILVVLLSVWLVVVILLGGEGATSLDTVLLYFAAPFMPPFWPISQDWLTAALFLALGLLPWTLLPIFVNWFRVIATSFAALKASRKDNSGPAWAWICLILGSAILLRQENNSLVAAAPLLPLVAFLFANALCHLSPRASRAFFLFIAVLFLLTGAVLTFVSIPATANTWAHLVPPLMKDVILSTEGLPLIAGILLLGSVVLLKFTRREFVGASLIVVTCCSLILIQPMTMLVAPSLTSTENDSYLRAHPLGSGLGVLPYGFGAQKPVFTEQENAPSIHNETTGMPQDTQKDMPEEVINQAPAQDLAPQASPPQSAPDQSHAPQTPTPAEPVPEGDVPADIQQPAATQLEAPAAQ